MYFINQVLIQAESHFGIQNDGKVPLVRRTGNNIMRMDDAAKLTGNDGPSKGAKCVGGGGGGRPGPPGPPRKYP